MEILLVVILYKYKVNSLEHVIIYGIIENLQFKSYCTDIISL